MVRTHTDFSKSLASSMAELTCEIARTCAEKESYFAGMFNITPAEFKCLRLFRNKKCLSIREISTELKISAGRVTHIITALEENEFITRKVNPHDKRNVIVCLTEKSEPFIKNLTENHVKLHWDILKNIEPERREDIIAALQEVINALRKWSATLKP